MVEYTGQSFIHSETTSKMGFHIDEQLPFRFKFRSEVSIGAFPSLVSRGRFLYLSKLRRLRERL